MTDYDNILASIEALAENDIDIVPFVYRHLFEQSKGAEEVFSATPVNQRGTMVNKVIEMIMAHAEDSYDMEEFRELDIPMHDELGVTPIMYREYFDALIASFKEALSDQWLAQYEEAWSRQFDSLIAEVSQHSEHAP